MNNAETCPSALGSVAPSGALTPKAHRATRQLSPTAAFFLLASITVSFLAGSLAPTPLYPVYQAQWGFSALTVTEIFGIYALVLLAALLVAGRLSDHIGRRPVLITATLVQAATMLLFANASGLEGLLLARVLQGLATGAALGAVGAGMLDLDKTRGPLANAVTPPVGTGLGGLMAGLMVHYLPAPTVTVYLVLGVVFLLQTLGLVFMAETVSPRAGAWASLRPRLSLPAAARAPMLLALPILVAAWSLAGLYASLVPALLRVVFGLNASLAGGVAAFALAGCGAVAVLLLQNHAPRVVMRLGAVGLLLGITLVGLSLGHASVAGFFAGTMLAGAGFGASFQGAVRIVVPNAKPHERAGVLSVVFVVSYIAMGLPAVIAGFFVARNGNLLATAQQFGALVALLAALALLGSWLGGRRGS